MPTVAHAVLATDHSYAVGIAGHVQFAVCSSGDIGTIAAVGYTSSGANTSTGHSWHVHQNAVDGSNCASAGGHYDPGQLEVSNYVCHANNATGCWKGDLRGKLGPISLAHPASAVTGVDRGGVALSEFIGRSVVVHAADGARIACGSVVVGAYDAAVASPCYTLSAADGGLEELTKEGWLWVIFLGSISIICMALGVTYCYMFDRRRYKAVLETTGLDRLMIFQTHTPLWLGEEIAKYEQMELASNRDGRDIRAKAIALFEEASLASQNRRSTKNNTLARTASSAQGHLSRNVVRTVCKQEQLNVGDFFDGIFDAFDDDESESLELEEFIKLYAVMALKALSAAEDTMTLQAPEMPDSPELGPQGGTPGPLLLALDQPKPKKKSERRSERRAAPPLPTEDTRASAPAAMQATRGGDMI